MEEDKQQRNNEPQKIEITTEENKGSPDELNKQVRVKMDTEDVIAISAGVVAVIFALGMVFGLLPVDKLTIGVLTFSGVGAAIATIIGARRKKKRK